MLLVSLLSQFRRQLAIVAIVAAVAVVCAASAAEYMCALFIINYAV